MFSPIFIYIMGERFGKHDISCSRINFTSKTTGRGGIAANNDAPVKSQNSISHTLYMVVRTLVHYLIWCITRPLRTFYEIVDNGELAKSPIAVMPDSIRHPEF